MVPTTKPDPSISGVVRDFYDSLAPDYDEMTSFDRRFVQEKPFFRMLVERHRIGSALDAGCGTGFHSLLLAQLGVRVIAVDLSPEMLTRVRAHARQMEIDLNVVKAEFRELASVVQKPVDAVFSMGNSLAHLTSSDELFEALKNFAALLKPGGILFLQNLNYHRILSQRERIQSIKECGTKTYVRFYDFLDPLLSFNILTIDRQEGGAKQTLQSIPLRPVLKKELIPLLHEAGFNELTWYGGISMEEFKQDTSKDLVVLARKPDAESSSSATHQKSGS